MASSKNEGCMDWTGKMHTASDSSMGAGAGKNKAPSSDSWNMPAKEMPAKAPMKGSGPMAMGKMRGR